MQTKNSTQIIVIGAGMSGLAACNHLHQYGFDVMILEARNRAGGRVCTDYGLNIPINLGAAWIHGIDGNPMTMLAENAQTTMKIPDSKKFIAYDRNGHLIQKEIRQQFDEKFELLLQKAKVLSFKCKNDMPLSEALTKVITFDELNSLEKDLFQSKLQYFEGYIGADYELLSARYWNLEEPWPGDTAYLVGTYQPIINNLAANCNIQFNSIVKEINLRCNDVEVVTENSVFSADFVVVTLPLGVLQKNAVLFNPPLPELKQKAIHQLGMGLLNVTVIKFPMTFWPKDSQAFRISPYDNMSIPIFLNLHYFYGQPVLMAYHGGERARRIEKLTEKQLMQLILRDLKKIFGENITEPEALITTHWSQDIFSYGSYSYLSVGATANDYDAIAYPIKDRLFFAGEATNSKFFATTHGAYLSGIREADRIKQLIDFKKG